MNTCRFVDPDLLHVRSIEVLLKGAEPRHRVIDGSGDEIGVCEGRQSARCRALVVVCDDLVDEPLHLLRCSHGIQPSAPHEFADLVLYQARRVHGAER
ncbi:MAG TPA: hypothetical protein VHV75_00870 [Solirubrobacteraceae bacterium]|nr:hypothetical protein [Solirubrobacteraceae bacterium]